jgi:hypothetical protein
MLAVLTTAAWNILRVWSSVELAGALRKYISWPGPWYIGLTGAVFAIGGFAVTWAIWRRKPWAPKALLGGAIAYAGWSWLDRLLIQPVLDTGWQFSLLMTTVLLAFIALVALDPRNRYYF